VLNRHPSFCSRSVRGSSGFDKTPLKLTCRRCFSSCIKRTKAKPWTQSYLWKKSVLAKEEEERGFLPPGKQVLVGWHGHAKAQ